MIVADDATASVDTILLDVRSAQCAWKACATAPWYFVSMTGTVTLGGVRLVPNIIGSPVRVAGI